MQSGAREHPAFFPICNLQFAICNLQFSLPPARLYARRTARCDRDHRDARRGRDGGPGQDPGGGPCRRHQGHGRQAPRPGNAEGGVLRVPADTHEPERHPKARPAGIRRAPQAGAAGPDAHGNARTLVRYHHGPLGCRLAATVAATYLPDQVQREQAGGKLRSSAGQVPLSVGHDCHSGGQDHVQQQRDCPQSRRRRLADVHRRLGQPHRVPPLGPGCDDVVGHPNRRHVGRQPPSRPVRPELHRAHSLSPLPADLRRRAQQGQRVRRLRHRAGQRGRAERLHHHRPDARSVSAPRTWARGLRPRSARSCPPAVFL